MRLMPWATHVLQWPRQRVASRKGELTPKPVLSSDCRLQLACMKPESLVIVGQPYDDEFFPGPSTRRPSQYGS
ncbi:hypothetical protein KSP39_PZI017215 [Platanthera zijinensis]|uniref:Uncharacterized protein n=1 Tax=Platanthera zijinensis TaxID=2320716 RepID=A0AAP0B6F9_9ASPA